MPIAAWLKLTRYTEFHELTGIHMHLDLHPSAGNVSVYTGQVRFGSADFFQTGCVEELTTCTVRTESLRADGPLESVTLDWTLFPNSPRIVSRILSYPVLFDAKFFLQRTRIRYSRENNSICRE